MMQPIPIQLKERIPLSRSGEPLRFGVPLVKGAIFDTDRLQLSAADSAPLLAQFRPLSNWPDGSIRWVCVDTLLTCGTSSSLPNGLMLSEAELPEKPTADILTDDHQLKVRYDAFQLLVEGDSVQWQWSGPGDQSFSSQLKLYDQQDAPCTAHLDDNWEVTGTGPVATTLMTSGWWHDSAGNKLARFRCELTLYANGLVTADATIHNPRRAKHQGGLWDLGDPGSIHFGGMVIETATPQSEHFQLTLSTNEEPRSYRAEQRLSLHQESSGGDNWDSRNHVNANGQVLPRYRGFRLQYGAAEPEMGLRASPVLESGTGNTSIAISLPHFWQNFPSAISADDSSVCAWLFPSDKREAYELQGGERKTQRVILGYGQRLEQVTWSHSPLVPVIPAEHYESAEAFPWFRANQPKTVLDELIQEGLDGPSNFFAKREVIDEYGWRNFGDIFADHETLYQKDGEEPFISHYNNQYDAIYGFARQFALTGDPRWFELMDDLARHVVDIDIYHTDEDRAEYNHGLFWHTDHYLDAHTSTHRTFSRHNDTSSTPGQTGGGPAEEHCYSTGHLYHYWMTGNEDSKTAVLELANWMQNLHEGEKGLLASLLALKKKEIPKLRALLRGEHVTPHYYPFTRGTGNYINALLDAHLVEPDSEWLKMAEQIIRASIHPADDIHRRNLLNVETSWSYLILLSSIARYLILKAERNESDEQWDYARSSLLHYAKWVCENERPFLDSTADLEYSNHTWVAQDIRKAVLMFQAATFCAKDRDLYISQGLEWLEYVTHTLEESPERHLARLVVVLMQSYGAQHQPVTCPPQQDSPVGPPAPYTTPALGTAMLLRQIVARLINGALHFRPRREKAWLRARW